MTSRCAAVPAAALVLAGVIGVPAPVAAQVDGEAARRPWRGLFESREAGERRQTLDLSIALFGAWDDNATEGLHESQVDRRVQTEGYYSGLNAGLAYARRSDRLSFGVSGSSASAHYASVSDRVVASGALRTNVAATLGRTTLRVAQGASYSPFFGLVIGGGLSDGELAAGPSAFDFSVRSQDVYRFDTAVEVTQTIGGRVTLSAFGDYQRTEFGGGDDGDSHWTGLQSYRIGARLSRGITRHAGLRLGYAYREGRYGQPAGGDPVVETHEIDAGVDYGRALSFSRRTSLSFSTGSGLVARQAADSDDPRQPAGERLRAHLLANAALTHEINRTWTARLAYSRDLQYVDGFTEPFLADRADASLGGTFNRRVDSRLAASYSSGAVGPGSGQGYAVWSGTADLRIALARRAALFTRYVYHHYQFNDATTLPPGFAPRLDRHGVRLGLSVWLPII